MKVLGFTDKSSEPANYKLPENMMKMRKTRKLNCLHEISAKVVDEFVFNSGEVNGLIDRVLTEQEKDILQQQELIPDGRFPCRFPSCTRSLKYNGKARRSHELSHDPPVAIDSDLIQQVTTSTPMATSQDTKPDDDVFNYNCFLFFNFLDAIKEGDGVRVMRQYNYFMLYCKADGSSSTKYALECLYQFFQIYALLSPRDSERFIWNRFVNNSGKRGSNIPLNEDTEHSNNFIKQGIKNLGPNVMEKAVQRLSYSENSTSMIMGNLDDNIKRLLRSGRHSSASLEKDLHELVKRAIESKIFTKQEGRSYKEFRRDKGQTFQFRCLLFV